MHRRFRQVFTSLKEHTSVNYAKIVTIGGFCDLNLILVKATSPDDLPLQERYIHEIIKVFSISPPSYHTFSLAFSRRFSKTNSWRVALKCLTLLHRLIRALPNESPLRAEMLFVRSHGLLSLNLCNFRDSSSYASDDYTNFIRSYARLLDEALDCSSITCNETYEDESDEVVPKNLPNKMKELGEVLEILPQVQSMIDRVMDCQPIGAAARSFLVHSAMKTIIRDSFICYTTFREEIVEVLDNLIQMPYRSSIIAFGVYKKASSQASQLSEFYNWCKLMGLCGPYEYPFVDKIPEIQIEALENFLCGMWQITDSSSSTSSRTQSPTSSKEEDYEEGDNLQMVLFDNYMNEKGDHVLKKDEEMEPLIKFDDDEVNEEINNVSWEVLLEASVSPSLVVSKNYFFFGQQPSSTVQSLQVYNPYPINPFQQQHSLI